ncbi:hypothetical protein PRUB_b0426 [Pseudoalteromonas rubra]|uniref:Uncharacterized protein n=1 Tax=Pseudoalteromonas rubra TaxID=43658 RepID=A0A8T0BZS9_9GAMM|nr:hypothetical protein PRUB_b0426 [Pseudoalteromonas rubra]
MIFFFPGRYRADKHQRALEYCIKYNIFIPLLFILHTEDTGLDPHTC